MQGLKQHIVNIYLSSEQAQLVAKWLKTGVSSPS